MANEWKLVRETSVPIPFTTATTFEKGTALKITDPNTVEATTADADRFIGVAATEVVTGQTKCDVWTSGVFIVTDSGAGVVAGDTLKMNGANVVAAQDEAGAMAPSETVGIALETAGAGNTFLALIGKP